MRIAIVTARYGVDVVGGAERHARGLAESMLADGRWQPEVLTSCALRQDVWENQCSPGLEAINGVPVRRFAVTPYDREAWVKLGQQLRLSADSAEKQYDWLMQGEQCEALYRWLAQNHQRYDIILGMPYLSSVVYSAAWIAPHKTVIWPLLHNEPYAYMEPFRLLAESVRGIISNTPESSQLAREMVGWRLKHNAVVGVGVELEPPTAHNLAANDVAYLLYLGRLVGGKNLRLLYDYAERYFEEEGDVQLAIIGRGPLPPPKHDAFRLFGAVDETTKSQVIANALAVCQPSLMESFSLVIMEGWLHKRPALVHADSAVTSGHIMRSGGGHSFRTYNDYRASVKRLLDPAYADTLGQAGSVYVEQNYRWPAVLDRIAVALESWGLMTS